MGCCNELATALEPATFDPAEHVNFTKGMVLGVDDFRQEFAYLSGRDEWLARDAVGYGTLSGLHVFVEEGGAEGPRLHVSAGSALVPSGKHVCVGADQCAVLNKWLAKPANAAIVNQVLDPGAATSSPPMSPPDGTSGTISLYLTLCYADCTAFPVPIPGEPCRSEADLMADSRVVDDFRLELRKDPPAQVEEDALRDFVRWLHTNVQAGATGSPPGDEATWLAALRAAVQPWLDAEALSPPPSPPVSVGTLGDYLFDLSPGGVQVGDGQMCDFLRVAFRFWVTELRPMWMARLCHMPMVKDQDCVLLARVAFDVEFIGGSPAGAWQVVGSPAIVVVDESTRPFLAHLRLIHEWMMCGCDCAGMGAALAAGGGGGMVPLVMHRGIAPAPPVAARPFPLIVAKESLALDESHYAVVIKGAPRAVKIALPLSDAANVGRTFLIRNVDASSVSVQVQPGSGDTVEEKASLAVKKKTAVTLVADGEGGWWAAATAQ
ncbi:MAG TPA: hypothetical protein VFJ62_02610 [Usitatibacter sp.]|nr:hypothetical protein [Usitatibacter sp.]